MELLELTSTPQGAVPSAPGEPESDGVPRLVAHLVMLAGLLKELETQSHLIHANAEGPQFLSVHAFLKERYEEHLEQFDQVLETVRTLDHFVPMCSCGLQEAVGCFRHVTSYDAREMLVTYYRNIEAMGYLAKEIEQVAAQVEAPDVQNLMAELVGSAFRTSWLLKSMLRCGA
jgi:DNA-binding ferritin-like protein